MQIGKKYYANLKLTKRQFKRKPLGEFYIKLDKYNEYRRYQRYKKKAAKRAPKAE